VVTVPDYLKGATILDAHQWVISNLDGRNEYVLRDMSGMETTLSDLTRGTVTEVNITPAGVRANPAPSYVFKPEFQPQKRVRQFSSRVMLPEGISPSVVHALEAKHGGAYRFIASKMLSQRSRRQQLSPRGTRMLSSFIMADPYAGVRNNPVGLRHTPSGIRMARVIGDKGRLMDDAIIAEVRGYLEGNEIPFDIAASERQFNDFTKGVLQPYLISLRSNQALIKYLNETLLPHMLRLIDAGEYDADMAEIGFFRKAFKSAVEAKTVLKSAAGKDKVKKLLSDQYETVVRRLATSPQDFYYGRNEALVAHPAFLFPHAAAFLIPPPHRLTGGTRAELFFYQAGEPPRYSVAGQGEDRRIVQELPQRMLKKIPLTEEGVAILPIARVNNAPVDYGDIMNVQSVQRALSTGNVGQVILMASQAFANDGVLKRMFGLGAATPPSGLTEEEGNALLDLNRIVQRMQNAGPLELFRGVGAEDPEAFPLAAAIEVNIGGIKPKPMGWPEGLIFALMQVIAENADEIMRTEGHGEGDFFRPNLEGLGPQTIRLVAPHDIDKKIEGFAPLMQTTIKAYYSRGLTLADLSRESDSAGDLNPAYAASVALHFATNCEGTALNDNMIPNESGQRASAKKNFKDNTARDPRTQYKTGDARLQKFNYAIREDRQGRPERLGLMSILQLALTRYKQDGGQPTPEQVTFVGQLALYALTNMSTDFDAMDDFNLFDSIADGLQMFDDLAEERRQNRMTEFIAQIDQRRALIPEENVLQQMVEDRLLEQFLDELLAGNALDDVFDNPRRNPPLPSLAEMIGDGPKDMDAIKRARDTLRQRRRQQRSGLASGPFTPDEKTVERLANSLRGVFQQALAEVEDERKAAEERLARQQEVTRLLGALETREALADELNAYQQMIVDVERSLRALLKNEQELVEAFEAVPMDPTMVLEDNLTRGEMFNHPLYITQNLLGQYNMFMNNVAFTENSLRTALSVVRGESVRTGFVDIHAPNINYLIAGIEFCNGLQEEYANIGSALGSAVDDMRVDDKDSISPHLYIALFDIADNFVIKEGIRVALRDSDSTSGRSVDPMIAEAAFDSIVRKSFDLIGTLFGAFPGDVPTNPPNIVMDMANTYLNSLVDEDLDFAGDMRSEHRRGELVAQAVSTTESMERMMKRQLEGYYDRLARAEARETFSGDIGLPSFLTTGIDAAIARTDELAKRSVFDPAGGDMYRAQQMFADIEKEIEETKQRKAAVRSSVLADLMKEAQQQNLDYANVIAREGPYVDPTTIGYTPEQIEAGNRYKMAIASNRAKIETMALAGQVTEKERDRWLAGHPVHAPHGYHWTALEAMKEGQRKSARVRGEDAKKRAEIKEIEKALKDAPEGFKIDDPARVAEDLAFGAAYEAYLEEQADAIKMLPKSDVEEARQAQEERIIGRNPPVVRWSV
tara:strand:+ start:5418 stop:9701 length:4284 start_codon:yes stop_codon:yes gene_type:complete